MTQELKRDLQLLKMRNVLDSARHYKKGSVKAKAPEYSQTGSIVEGPTEYSSARINNRDRRQTLADEVLAEERSTGRFKAKFSNVQVSKSSGGKAHYNSRAKKELRPRK